MKKIFAVDDSKSIRLYMDQVLSKKGYDIELADDGDTALDRLGNHSEPIDVFIIDIVMKKMDGITLIKHIRQLERFSSTPVIVLTNMDDPTVVDRAKEAGADCWISKPFDAEQISEAVQRLVQ